MESLISIPIMIPFIADKHNHRGTIVARPLSDNTTRSIDPQLSYEAIIGYHLGVIVQPDADIEHTQIIDVDDSATIIQRTLTDFLEQSTIEQLLCIVINRNNENIALKAEELESLPIYDSFQHFVIKCIHNDEPEIIVPSNVTLSMGVTILKYGAGAGLNVLRFGINYPILCLFSISYFMLL